MRRRHYSYFGSIPAGIAWIGIVLAIATPILILASILERVL